MRDSLDALPAQCKMHEDVYGANAKGAVGDDARRDGGGDDRGHARRVFHRDSLLDTDFVVWVMRSEE